MIVEVSASAITKANVELQMLECSRSCEADGKWTNQEEKYESPTRLRDEVDVNSRKRRRHRNGRNIDSVESLSWISENRHMKGISYCVHLPSRYATNTGQSLRLPVLEKHLSSRIKIVRWDVMQLQCRKVTMWRKKVNRTLVMPIMEGFKVVKVWYSRAHLSVHC